MMNFFTCACGVFALFAAHVWAGSIPYEDEGYTGWVIGTIGWIALGSYILIGITSLVLAFALPPDGTAINIAGTILWGLFMLIFIVVAIDHGSTGPGSF